MELWMYGEPGSAPLNPDGSFPEKLCALIREFCDPSYTALAWFADRFQSGKGNSLMKLLHAPDTLLELRVFREDRELWVHRSCIGDPFHWRVADDAALRENTARIENTKRSADSFFRKAENYFLKTYQLLDIARRGEADSSGMRNILTTVGGRYALPIGEKDRYMAVISYLRYTDGGAMDGTANVVDYRLAGFCERAGGGNQHAAGSQSV